MASTASLAATLPRQADNTERHNEDHTGDKFAVYTLVSVPPATLQELEDALNADDQEELSCKLAPNPDFSEKTLRDVYDHYVAVRDTEDYAEMNPTCFIVADQLDWTTKGVLLVNLGVWGDGDENDVNGVDVARCGVDEAGSWLINLEIANMDWSECKDAEEEKWSVGGEGDGEESEDEGEDQE